MIMSSFKMNFLSSIFSFVIFINVSEILNAGPEYENDLKTIPYYILPRLLLLREDFPKDKVRAVTDEIMEHHFGQKTIDYNQIGGIVEVCRSTVILIRWLPV